MSDFLTSLAARAVAPVPAIRPAVRSPYEPHTGVESTWPVPVTAAVPVEPALTAPQSPARSQAPVPVAEMESSPHESEYRTPVRPTPRLNVASGMTSGPPPPVPAIPDPVPVRREPVRRKSEYSRPAATAGAEHAPALPSPSAVRPVSAPLTVRPAVPPAASPPPLPDDDIRSVRPGRKSADETPRDTSPAAPAPQSRPAPLLPPAAAPLPRLSRPPSDAAPAPLPRLPLPPSDAAAALLSRLPQPQRSPLAAAATRVLPDKTPSRPAAPQAPPPAPEVTITIGRVEIRAAAPAAQAPAPGPSAAGPHLSLEAYLRRSASRPA